MESQEKILDLIKLKYPHQDMRIEQLYEEDEEFQSLCADYLSCLDAIRKLRRLADEHKQSLEDYESMVRDLENELHDFIYG